MNPPADQSLPPLVSNTPPLLTRNPSSLRKLLASLLSLCLWIFLAAGIVSLLDDSLVLLLGRHLLTAISGLFTLLSFLLVLAVYLLMGLTPLVPKRVILPLAFYTGLGMSAGFPTMIYHHNQ